MATDFSSTNWTTSMQSISDPNSGLGKLLSDGETSIQSTIASLQSTDAASLSQADLLAAQQAIQSWSLVSSMLTSMMRAVGDGLSKVTQNIR